MEKVKKSLVKKEYLVPFVLVTSLFFLWGFAHGLFHNGYPSRTFY